MKVGIVVRNMGSVSTREVMLACAAHAEQAGLAHVWVTDHIAIPREDSEGSGGRYIDPLAALAFLAAATQRIGLGVGVLVLPYRPALPTAKWLASIQELSGGRLLFGAGVGWMPAEFRATGADRSRRGATTDATLAFINDCFASDEVTANGQRFLFLPRPARPPVLIGGASTYAFPRIVAYGDGWLPGRTSPTELAPEVVRLAGLLAEVGRPAPQVVVLTNLDDDTGKAAEQAAAYARAGATGLIHFARYADADEFARIADRLARLAD